MTGTGRQKNIDYAICQALNAKNMRGIKRTLLIYDIMCQWSKWFLERVKESPYLEVPEGLEILKAIGDFHVKGHVKDCLTRFGLAFIDGVGIIDGEVLETLWSVLNESSRSTRGATLAHRAEILDDHMNHSNWKKLVGIGKTHIVLLFLIAEPVFLVTSLVKKWKRALMLYSNAEEAFVNLSATADPSWVARWTEEADKAKAGRHENVKAMDYFQVAEFPGIEVLLILYLELTQVLLPGTAPGRAQMQLDLTRNEPTTGIVGLAEFLVQGLKIQETQFVILPAILDSC